MDRIRTGCQKISKEFWPSDLWRYKIRATLRGTCKSQRALTYVFSVSRIWNSFIQVGACFRAQWRRSTRCPSGCSCTPLGRVFHLGWRPRTAPRLGRLYTWWAVAIRREQRALEAAWRSNWRSWCVPTVRKCWRDIKMCGNCRKTGWGTSYDHPSIKCLGRQKQSDKPNSSIKNVLDRSVIHVSSGLTVSACQNKRVEYVLHRDFILFY